MKSKPTSNDLKAINEEVEKYREILDANISAINQEKLNFELISKDIDSLSLHKKEKEEEAKSLNEEIEKVKLSLIEHQNNFSAKVAQYEIDYKKIEIVFQNNINDLKAEIKNLENSIEKLKKEELSKKSISKELDNEIEIKKDDIVQLEKRISDGIKQLGVANNNLIFARNSCDEKIKEYNELNILIDEGNNKLNVIEEKEVEVNDNLGKLEMEIVDANNELSGVKDMIATNEKYLEELDPKIEEKEAILNNSMKKIGYLTQREEVLDAQEEFIKSKYEKVGIPYQSI